MTEGDEIRERGSVGVKNKDGEMDGNSGRKVIDEQTHLWVNLTE